tara:strand:- start:193 stop:2931 length:2739 start_codon:yes stop_codon:yes gene_type:complete
MNQHDLESLLFELDDEDFANLTEEHIAILASNNGLSDDELNELLGFTRKKTLIKKIMDRDPQADEAELKALSKSALKKMLKAKQEEAGEDTRGFFAKTVDRIKGIKDIGMFGNKAGTLLGGNETFDIKKRQELKDNAKREAESWLKAIEYKPLSDLYDELVQAEFPNKANKSGFKTEAAKFQKIYDDVVSAHDAEQLDTKTANTIIAVLRGVVIYFQDFAMNDQYYYRESKEESLADLLFEEVEGQEEKSIGRKEGDVAANFEAAYGYKLPLVLIGTGAAMMTLGWAADTPFAQDLMQSMKDVTTTTVPGKTVTQTISKSVGLGEVKPEEGIIRVVRRITGDGTFGKAGGPSMGTVFGGGKNAQLLKLIKASMMDSKGPAAVDNLISSNADPVTAFVGGAGDATSGMGKAGSELFGIDPGQFSENVSQTLSQSMPDQTRIVEDDTFRNDVLNGLMKWAGPLLKGFGLGFLAAGAASGFLRWKGKGGKKGSGKIRGSRMSILKVMVDGFEDVGKEGGEDDPPLPPPGEDEQIVIDLFANRMTITVKDPETGEEEEVDLDLSGYVPNLPALVELGITTPDAIIDLLSEAHEGEFIFKNRQGEPKNYPEDEGTFGASFKNFDDYPTLLKWVNALLKVKHPEFGPITKEMLDGAVGDGQFTLNDKRTGGKDDPPVPPVPPKPGDDKPRLAILRLDDDGVHAHRTRGGITLKRYETEKERFQAAQDQGITGKDTTPSSSDLDDRRKGVTHLGRNKPVKDRTYDQMVKDMGSPDLRRKGVEVEPYFTVDKSVTSDIYLKKDKKSKTSKGGSFEYPKLGAKNKAATQRLVQKIFNQFVSNKSKVSRAAANKAVSNAFGDKRRQSFQDKATRDKIVDVLVTYGLVKEGPESTDVITESRAHEQSQVDERWMTLAGLGEGK